MQITEQQAIGFIKKINDAKSQTSFINGELGQELKDAAENGGFDLKALKDIARLGRIGEQRRDAYLETFEALMDICRPIWRTEEHVGDLDKLARQKTGEEDSKRSVRSVGAMILEEAARVADVSAQIGLGNAAKVARGIKKLEVIDENTVLSPPAKKRGRPAKAKPEMSAADREEYKGFN